MSLRSSGPHLRMCPCPGQDGAGRHTTLTQPQQIPIMITSSRNDKLGHRSHQHITSSESDVNVNKLLHFNNMQERVISQPWTKNKYWKQIFMSSRFPKIDRLPIHCVLVKVYFDPLFQHKLYQIYQVYQVTYNWELTTQLDKIILKQTNGRCFNVAEEHDTGRHITRSLALTYLPVTI